MAWNKDHKQQSRQRILDAAASLFSQRGFDGVGIDQVMSEAGMTRGAFYSHFQSKSELYRHAMSQAAHRMFRQVQPDDGWQFDRRRLIEGYLSDPHVNSDGVGCPLAFLITDVAQQQPDIRDTYTALFANMAERFTQDSPEQRQNVLQNMVMMIGGVAIARALSEPALKQEVLQAVRSALEAEAS
ncbi:TetR/AcrR family transcriptional regulator [Oceanobacter mangrovi]|uniref:TetR/AcrR family transcriptional regulator n=1 Tax=Oceanobacter mangrovi TaxID=2862510 RepID=UPI001C8EF8F7|nr:TetR/AcrR family transcriptional regulator [Oceanobacter mangrovi]